MVSGLTAIGIAALVLAAGSAVAGEKAHPNTSLFPPWGHGDDSDVADRGVDFTVPDVDTMADIHGDVTAPKLVLYVGGNYFFVMGPLVAAFEHAHPEYEGGLLYETLPPGLLAKQMETGGTLTSGNMTFTAKPDAYLAGLGKIKELIAKGMLDGPAVPYVTNTLTIMAPKDNPARVASLADLGRPDIRVVMPNPVTEGIARQIKAALTKAGGAALAATVYETKVKDGTTVLTRIHHRQTPLDLMRGPAEAGVTWQSEAVFQDRIGHPIAHVDIPPAQNATGVYAGAVVRGAAHPEAAKAWLAFLTSSMALAIFEDYGFKPYKGEDD